MDPVALDSQDSRVYSRESAPAQAAKEKRDMHDLTVQRMSNSRQGARFIQACVKRYSEVSPYADIDPRRIVEMTGRAITHDDYCIFIGYVGETPELYIGAQVSEPWHSYKREAHMASLFTPAGDTHKRYFPRLLKLCIEDYEEWAREQGAVRTELCFDSELHNIETLGKLFERVGYERVGAYYRRAT